MKDYKTHYNKLLMQVEDLLDEYIPDREPTILYEPFRYIVSSGGKRIRPVLTMLSCGAVGGDAHDAIYAGAAIEIMHNFTLVHDDIMDESPIRRGKQTIHLKWDEPTAILTGDVMVGYSYKLLENYSSRTQVAKMYETLTHGLIEVCEGQVFDMMFNEKKDVSVDDYLLTIRKKTAKILETCVVMGAYAGNATELQIAALKEYALYLGIAFQMQDDVLDLTADEAALGKHIGQDIIEGKKTWLMIEARKRVAKPEDKELIDRFFTNNGLDESDIDNIRRILFDLNIIEDATNEAQQYFEKAKAALGPLEPNEYTEMLLWLADTLNKRKY
jgi:geranylgeranyl diphosphate synthase type II